MTTGQIVLLMLLFAFVTVFVCAVSTYSKDEKEEESPELLEVPQDHIYNMDEKENAKEYYTDETITRSILIKLLNNNGISGISKLKKSELLEKMHEMHIPFPEVTDEQNQSKSE